MKWNDFTPTQQKAIVKYSKKGCKSVFCIDCPLWDSPRADCIIVNVDIENITEVTKACAELINEVVAEILEEQ